MTITLAELIDIRKALPPVPPDVARASLADRFLIPPFSVLDARQGYWQKRKKMWLELGIQSELGRGDGLLGFSSEARSHYMFKTADGYKPLKDIQADNQAIKDHAWLAALPQAGIGVPVQSASHDGLTVGVTCDAYRKEGEETVAAQSGSSIFDPVLCEIAYRWFCPKGGRVLDPFAGGSVRGIVAAKLGRTYAGVDLRPEQAEANYAQMEVLCPDADLTWSVGDSQGITDLLPGEYDLIFSCPPYFDLERYSDDPRDLSTMGYDGFLAVYRDIIAKSCSMLKDNRFACFVVGDVRDRATGNYRGFVGDTIAAFRSAGLELYNEAVLVTSVGSLPIRVGRQFAGCRKLGKTHQNVLVFVKGDPTLATTACGEVDVDDLSMPECVIGSVALCRHDVVGTIAEPYLMGDEEYDACHVYLPPVGSYLLVDVVRGQSRSEGKAMPRAWLGTPEGWSRIDDGVDMTYLVGGTPYLTRSLFPDAKGPTDATPVPRRLR